MESESLKTIIVVKIGPNTFRANLQDIITDFLQLLNRPSHTVTKIDNNSVTQIWGPIGALAYFSFVF